MKQFFFEHYSSTQHGIACLFICSWSIQGLSDRRRAESSPHFCYLRYKLYSIVIFILIFKPLFRVFRMVVPWISVLQQFYFCILVTCMGCLCLYRLFLVSLVLGGCDSSCSIAWLQLSKERQTSLYWLDAQDRNQHEVHTCFCPSAKSALTSIPC